MSNRGLHRAIPYMLLALLALGCTLAAMGTDIARYDDVVAGGGTLGENMDVWHLCQYSGQPVAGAQSDTFCAPVRRLRCTELKDRLRAAEAFYIMTAIVLLLALMAAARDHGSHGSGRGFFSYLKVILLLLALLTIVFSIIAWALAFSVAREDFCEGEGDGIAFLAAKDRPNFKYRASPFLLIATTVLAIAMLLAALLGRHHSTDHAVHTDRRDEVVVRQPAVVEHHRPVPVV